jgi:hypothetical protein
MPTVVISKKPELTPEKAFEIFKVKFGSKYNMYISKLPRIDFVLKKSAWSGIAVKIVQKPDKTIIRFGAFSPSAFVRLLQMGLIPLLILWFTSWKAMQNEVKEFISGEPQLK